MARQPHLVITELKNVQGLEVPDLQQLLVDATKKHPVITASGLHDHMARGLEQATVACWLARIGLQLVGFSAVDVPSILIPHPWLTFLYSSQSGNAKVRNQLLAEAVAWAGKNGFDSLLTAYYKPGTAQALVRLSSRVTETKHVGELIAFNCKE